MEDYSVLEDLISSVAHDGWGQVADVSADCAGRIAAEFAKLLPNSAKRVAYQELRVKAADVARPGSMSSIVGLEAQPMHTDGAFLPEPPRYLVFYCLDTGTSDRSTRIWALRPDQPSMALPIWLREVSWVARSNRDRSFYCPVVDLVAGVHRIRYDPLCMKRLRETSDHLTVEHAIRSSASETEMIWRQKDLLVVDNWRCLHARSEAKRGSMTEARRIGRWTIGGV